MGNGLIFHIITSADGRYITFGKAENITSHQRYITRAKHGHHCSSKRCIQEAGYKWIMATVNLTGVF